LVVRHLQHQAVLWCQPFALGCLAWISDSCLADDADFESMEPAIARTIRALKVT